MLAKAYLDLDNIETLFGALEFGLMINKFGNKKGKEIENLRDSLIRVIVTTIEYSINYQYTYHYKNDNSKIYPMPVFIEFFDKLKLRESKCNFSFVTFNYDLIIDIGLNSSLMKYNYSFEDMEFSEIPLLKLHGSLNWFTDKEKINVCPFPNETDIKNIIKENSSLDSDDFNSNRSEQEIVRKFLPIGSQIIKKGKLPLIIPPTLNKFKYHEQLKNVWRKAASVLSEAEVIIIIGYSMPETDVFFKYLYSLGIDSPKYLHKLIVINSDGSIQAKYNSLMNNQNSFKKFNFISGLFHENIDRIFIEIDNLI